MVESGSKAAKSRRLEVPEVLSRYRPLIDEGLRSVLDKDSNNAYVMMRYYMGWADVSGNAVLAETGKYLRPSLCLLSAEATGADLRKALPVAVSLELIHNFSLIHDDIEDQDEIRHHRKTLWAEWGIPKALMAGDLMFVLANRYLLGSNLTVDNYETCSNLLNEACLRMIEGQYLDLAYEGKFDLSVDDYMAMVSRKTGALLRCSVDSGVALGHCTTVQNDHFDNAASALGNAFQIRDDILGTWGDQNSTGKPVGADIRRKKNALPMVHMMNSLGEKSLQNMTMLMETDTLDEHSVQLILDLMGSFETYEFCQNLVEHLCSKAMSEIVCAEVPDKFTTDFAGIIEFIGKRVH